MDGNLIEIALVGGGIAGAYIAIIGVQRWASKHAANGTLHPPKADVMWKDVCDERSGAIRQQLEDLKQVTESGFTEVKKLIRESIKS